MIRLFRILACIGLTIGGVGRMSGSSRAGTPAAEPRRLFNTMAGPDGRERTLFRTVDWDSACAEPVLEPSVTPCSRIRGRGQRVVTVGLALPVIALVASLAAIAFWTSGGTGSATAGTGTLNPPASVGVSNLYGSGTVGVWWPASVSGGGAVVPQGYYIRRWAGVVPSVVGGACGTVAVPVDQVACDDTGVADGTYTYTVVAVFNSWTAESAASLPVTVFNDLTPPDFGSPALTITGTFGSSAWQYLSGTTVFYNPQASNSGSFTAEAENVVDPETGIEKVNFPALSGFSGGGDASNPGPFLATYGWTSTSAESGSQTVTAYNGVVPTPLTSTVSFTVTPDTTNPTGGSVTANGSGSDSYNTTGTIAIAKTLFGDAGSGIFSNVVTRASATLSGNSCTTSFSGAVVVPGATDSGLADGCYRYTLTGTDNVGNVATTQSAIVKVDTTPPSTPTLAFSGLSSNAYDNGSGTLFIRPASGGTFTVTASSSDADTNIQSYTFGSLNSDGGSNFGGSQTGNKFDYTFGATTTAPTTPRTVKATNNAGADSADASYSIAADSTAPTGGAITANGSGSDSYNTTGTIAISTTLFGDGVGSGIASNIVTRALATLSGNACTGGFIGAALVGGATDSGLTDGCYQYTLTGTDNVGNFATVQSAIVKVDQTKPVTSITLSPASPTGNSPWYKGPTAPTFTLSGSDAGSGVATTKYQIDSGAITTYSSAVTIPEGTHTVSYWSTDNAGNTETTNTTGTIKVDTVAPVTTLTTSPASPNGTNGWFKQASVTFTLGATDTTSLVGSTSYTIDAGATQTYSGTVTINTQGDHTVTFWSTDNAGNVESTNTTHIKLDNVGPTLSLALAASPVGAAFTAPGTLTYKANAIGSFRFAATVTDGTSGAASTAYPAIGTIGWTHATETVTGSSPYTSTTFSWTATPTNPFAGYTVTATDQAGNTTTQAITFVVDNTAPTVTVNSKAGQADPTNTLPILWTVTFSEPVTGFDASDLTRGGTSTVGTVSLTGSGASYEISLAGSPTNGTTSFTIAANRAQDLVGNNNTASTSSDNTVTYDTVAPVITALCPTNGGSYTNNSSGSTSWGHSSKCNGTFSVTVPLATSVTASLQFGAGSCWSGSSGSPAFTTTCPNQVALTNTTGNTWSRALTQAALADGTYTATVTATDSAGNVSTLVIAFTIT